MMDAWEAAAVGAVTGAVIELVHWFWNRRRR